LGRHHGNVYREKGQNYVERFKSSVERDFVGPKYAEKQISRQSYVKRKPGRGGGEYFEERRGRGGEGEPIDPKRHQDGKKERFSEGGNGGWKKRGSPNVKSTSPTVGVMHETDIGRQGSMQSGRGEGGRGKNGPGTGRERGR